jgi:hypothetical protein
MSIIGRAETRAEDITHENGLLVRYAIRDRAEAVVAVNYPYEICLGSSKTTAKNLAASPNAAVGAMLEFAPPAWNTGAAPRSRCGSNPVSGFESGHPGAYLLYDTDKLMPHNGSGTYPGEHAMNGVEVRAANGGSCNPHDKIPRRLDLRFRYIFQSQFVARLQYDCLHGSSFTSELCVVMPFSTGFAHRFSL